MSVAATHTPVWYVNQDQTGFMKRVLAKRVLEKRVAQEDADIECYLYLSESKRQASVMAKCVDHQLQYLNMLADTAANAQPMLHQ